MVSPSASREILVVPSDEASLAGRAPCPGTARRPWMARTTGRIEGPRNVARAYRRPRRDDGHDSCAWSPWPGRTGPMWKPWRVGHLATVLAGEPVGENGPALLSPSSADASPTKTARVTTLRASPSERGQICFHHPLSFIFSFLSLTDVRLDSTCIPSTMLCLARSRGVHWARDEKSSSTGRLVPLRNLQRLSRHELRVRASDTAEAEENATTDSSRQARRSTHAASPSNWNYGPIAGLATLGFVETAYLTGLSLTGQSDQVACPLSAASCSTVLTSPYAYLFDSIPLSLLGCGVYGAVAVVALRESRPWEVAAGKGEMDGGRGNGRGSLSSASPLVYLSTLLVSTSAYLAVLLATKFGDSPCVWCMTSIALSLGIGSQVFAGLDGKVREGMLTPLSGLFAATVLLLNSTLGSPDMADARDITKLEYQNPVVTTVSTGKAIDVAKRQDAVGAKMYGAFWCSHCFEQKETLGAEAMKTGKFYVECFPDGWERGKQMAGVCLAPLNGEGRKLQGFPTWVIGGQVMEGDKSVTELEKILDGIEK